MTRRSVSEAEPQLQCVVTQLPTGGKSFKWEDGTQLDCHTNGIIHFYHSDGSIFHLSSEPAPPFHTTGTVTQHTLRGDVFDVVVSNVGLYRELKRTHMRDDTDTSDTAADVAVAASPGSPSTYIPELLDHVDVDAEVKGKMSTQLLALHESEVQYLTQLQDLHNNFIAPVSRWIAKKRRAANTNLSIAMLPVVELHRTNLQMLNEIRHHAELQQYTQGMTPWLSSLLKLSQNLEAYSVYCDLLPSAVQDLEQAAAKVPRLAAVMEAFHENHGHKVTKLLQAPQRRLKWYIDFTTKMMRLMGLRKTHPDAQKLKQMQSNFKTATDPRIMQRARTRAATQRSTTGSALHRSGTRDSTGSRTTTSSRDARGTRNQVLTSADVAKFNRRRNEKSRQLVRTKR